MKPTPMIALPFVTLMMLLSSTFVRLPGTATIESGEVAFPQTDLSQFQTVTRTEAAALYDDTGVNNSSRSGGVRHPDAVRWTALGLDLSNEWHANVMYPDTARADVSNEPKAGHTMLAKQNNVMHSKHVARR